MVSIGDLASRRICTESESKVANLCNLSRLNPSTEPRFDLRVTVERQRHGLTQITHTRGGRQSLAPVVFFYVRENRLQYNP